MKPRAIVEDRVQNNYQITWSTARLGRMLPNVPLEACSSSSLSPTSPRPVSRKCYGQSGPPFLGKGGLIQKYVSKNQWVPTETYANAKPLTATNACTTPPFATVCSARTVGATAPGRKVLPQRRPRTIPVPGWGFQSGFAVKGNAHGRNISLTMPQPSGLRANQPG